MLVRRQYADRIQHGIQMTALRLSGFADMVAVYGYNTTGPAGRFSGAGQPLSNGVLGNV